MDSPRYFMVTAGTAGDMHPFLGLAKALQELGRPVTLVGPEYHRALVDAAGVPFEGIGTVQDYLDVIGNPEVWHPRRGWSVLFTGYAKQLTECARRLQRLLAGGGEPPVVITHLLTMPAALIARDTGVPMRLVNVALAPSNLSSCHDPLTLGPTRIAPWVPMGVRRALWGWGRRHVVNPPTLPGVNEARAAFGLPPIADYLDHIEDRADLTLTLFPAWFGRTQPDWPRPLLEGEFVLYDPQHPTPEAAASPELLSPPLREFLSAGQPPIVFTPGSGHAHAHHYFRAAVDACARLQRRAVLLTRFAEQVPTSLPASICWQPYAPLSALLPQAAALVHHGGIGTAAEALRAGVPQLVMPFAFDQFDNAERVRGLGVGSALRAARPSGRRLARTLRRLLQDGTITTAARQAATRIAQRQPLTALCLALEAALPATSISRPAP